MLANSCSTGIERTKTVTLSRADKKFLQKSPEESFIDSIIVTPLSSWQIGKQFVVTDNKASLLYDLYDAGGRLIHGDSLKGCNVSFMGVNKESDPAGGDVYHAVFSIDESGRKMTYRSRKDFDDLNKAIWSDFPFLIDKDILNQLNNLLRNRKLWIKTSLWNDSQGSQINGAKFIPVTVTDIEPGNGVFPMRVVFTDGKIIAYVPMNMKGGNALYESRTFPTLFSLADPKLAYPNITPEIWTLICEGNVTQGMTKEECKLSMGNPKDVESGHDWNSLMDYWKYDNGAYLMFQDGRLINYRK